MTSFQVISELSEVQQQAVEQYLSTVSMCNLDETMITTLDSLLSDKSKTLKHWRFYQVAWFGQRFGSAPTFRKFLEECTGMSLLSLYTESVKQNRYDIRRYLVEATQIYWAPIASNASVESAPKPIVKLEWSQQRIIARSLSKDESNLIMSRFGISEGEVKKGVNQSLLSLPAGFEFSLLSYICSNNVAQESWDRLYGEIEKKREEAKRKAEEDEKLRRFAEEGANAKAQAEEQLFRSKGGNDPAFEGDLQFIQNNLQRVKGFFDVKHYTYKTSNVTSEDNPFKDAILLLYTLAQQGCSYVHVRSSLDQLKNEITTEQIRQEEIRSKILEEQRNNKRFEQERKAFVDSRQRIPTPVSISVGIHQGYGNPPPYTMTGSIGVPPPDYMDTVRTQRENLGFAFPPPPPPQADISPNNNSFPDLSECHNCRSSFSNGMHFPCGHKYDCFECASKNEGKPCNCGKTIEKVLQSCSNCGVRIANGLNFPCGHHFNCFECASKNVGGMCNCGKIVVQVFKLA